MSKKNCRDLSNKNIGDIFDENGVKYKVYGYTINHVKKNGETSARTIKQAMKITGNKRGPVEKLRKYTDDEKNNMMNDYGNISLKDLYQKYNISAYMFKKLRENYIGSNNI